MLCKFISMLSNFTHAHLFYAVVVNSFLRPVFKSFKNDDIYPLINSYFTFECYSISVSSKFALFQPFVCYMEESGEWWGASSSWMHWFSRST